MVNNNNNKKKGNFLTNFISTIVKIFKSKPTEADDLSMPEDAPEHFRHRKVLNYYQQLNYLIFGNIISLIVIAISSVIPIILIAFVWWCIPDFYLIIAVIFLAFFGWVYLIILVFSQHQVIPPRYMGVPVFPTGRSTRFVAKEGWAVYIPKILEYELVNVTMVDVDDEFVNVKVAGGAYITARIAFTMQPWDVALVEFRNAKGQAEEGKNKNGIADRIDDDTESSIREVLASKSLQTVQAMEPDLLKAISIHMLNNLAPKAWDHQKPKQNTSNDDDANAFITSNNPVFVYSLGVKLYKLRFTEFKPSDKVRGAQENTMVEVYEKTSQLLDTFTTTKRTLYVIRMLLETGVDPKGIDPLAIFNQIAEQQNIANGAKTIPGLQGLLSSFISKLTQGIGGDSNSALVQVNQLIDKYDSMNVDDMKKELESIAEIMKVLGVTHN